MIVGSLSYFIGLSASNFIFFIQRKIKIMRQRYKKITLKNIFFFVYIALAYITLVIGAVYLLIIAKNLVTLNE
jgi:hypothetical protein